MYIRLDYGHYALVAVFFLVVLAACAPRLRTEPPQELLYTAVGASDAVGIGAFPLRRGYAFQVRDAYAMRFGPTRLVIAAIPGAEIREIRSVVEILAAATMRPDVVTVWVGANDLRAGADVDAFEAQLSELLRILRDWGTGPVIVGNIPDMTMLPAFQESLPATITDERIEAFNAAIGRQVDAHEAQLVDLYALPVERDLVSGIDGFHPSNEGHQRIGELFFEAILSTMGMI